MKWYKLPEDSIAGLGDEAICSVKVGNKTICLIKNAGSYFATQLTCPHAGANLSGGWCKEKKLICPYHRYEYDLDTGRGAPGQGDYIEIYKLEERIDGLYIQLPERFGFLKKLFRL